ncbi:hypothetical protein LCGC14_0925770 [marine sediment metagenome]|uniref:Uncharacterized protein n=1 Tax=marine sediment metagenome TaxID=412755 RepID=A0A0F9PA93_9ZZZZ
MVTGAAAAITATIPVIFASAVAMKVTKVAFKRNGKPVGTTHYHLNGKKVVRHRHEGGRLSHYHKGLKRYGKTRKTVKR